MTVLTMPERRPGQEIVTFYLPAGFKEKFKLLCQLKGTTMTEEFTRFVEEELKINEDLLKRVDEAVKGKG